jgi:hypothetical protein
MHRVHLALVSKSIDDSVMGTFLEIFIITVLALPSSVGLRSDARPPTNLTSHPDFLFCQATSSTRVRTENFVSISL